MSKLKIDNIKFDNDDFVVEIKPKKRENSFLTGHRDNKINIPLNKIEDFEQNQDNQNLFSQDEADNIIENAKTRADEMISEARAELDKLNSEIEAKKTELQNLENIQLEAQKNADELLENSQAEIENLKIQAANDGYQEGYKDAQEKILEELEEKIRNFDNFCLLQSQIKEKILKDASKDIIKIIKSISNRVLLEEIDGKRLSLIIDNTIALFEEKEEINIVLSEKYAKLLYEFQKKSLCDEVEFNFENFKQYENFNVVYKSGLDDDTIIIENSKERFDASLKSQLDAIISTIYENTLNEPFEFNLKENQSQNEIN